MEIPSVFIGTLQKSLLFAYNFHGEKANVFQWYFNKKIGVCIGFTPKIAKAIKKFFLKSPFILHVFPVMTSCFTFL